MQDSLGVVEPVDAEQDDLGLAQRLADLPGALPDVVPLRYLAEGGRVNRDRERRRVNLARPVRAARPDRRPPGGQAGGPAAGAQEVRRVGPALEAHQVRAEQALDHLPAPGELSEDLIPGERDVVEEADPDVAALRAEHLRDQLELIDEDPGM